MTQDEQQAGGLQDDEPQHGAADPWAQGHSSTDRKGKRGCPVPCPFGVLTVGRVPQQATSFLSYGCRLYGTDGLQLYTVRYSARVYSLRYNVRT